MSDANAHHDFAKSLRVYQKVLVLLLIMTGLTWGIAYVDLGGTMNTVIALSIAVFKALVVILLFMHVTHANRLVKIMVGAGGFWLCILFVMLMMDFVTRTYHWVDAWGLGG